MSAKNDTRSAPGAVNPKFVSPRCDAERISDSSHQQLAEKSSVVVPER
jgi:hypothetical protein